jgi:flagellar motility protein MotE (MotC chaperone)
MADDRTPVKSVKKVRRGVAAFLTLFFILAAIVSVMAFNVFNIRNRYIYPALSKLPLVGKLTPTADMTEDFDAMTPERMIARINELEARLSGANEEIKAAGEIIEKNKAEIERLKIFEDQQLNFKHEKEDFDRRVAMADPAAYADYYGSIYPENAEILYPQAAAESSRLSEIDKYMADITAMDEVSAANVLRQMIGSDMDLVVSILQGMDSRGVGNILSEMDPSEAASIIKMMAPFDAAPAAYPTAAPTDIVNELNDLPELP